MKKFISFTFGLILAFSNLNVFYVGKGDFFNRDFVEYKETHITAYADPVSPDSIAPTPVTTISYKSKTINSKQLAARFPSFYYSPKFGGCASVAGGNLLGYFDRYDENLIPNHASGTALGTSYLYRPEDQAVRQVIEKLYSYMGTTETGTTQTKFIDGFNRYCREKGKSVSYSSCMSSGAFSYTLAKRSLENNQPIILFLSGYNVALVSEGANEDSYTYYESTANHIMIGFGYKEYIYALMNGNTTLSFISVASGLEEIPTGQFNTNYKTKINDAIAVNIY